MANSCLDETKSMEKEILGGEVGSFWKQWALYQHCLLSDVGKHAQKQEKLVSALLETIGERPFRKTGAADPPPGPPDLKETREGPPDLPHVMLLPERPQSASPKSGSDFSTRRRAWGESADHDPAEVGDDCSVGDHRCSAWTTVVDDQSLDEQHPPDNAQAKVLKSKSFKMIDGRQSEVSERRKHAHFLETEKDELDAFVWAYDNRNWAERLTEYLENIQEPQREGRCADFVRSRWFGLACTCVIICDSVFTAYSADRAMESYAKQKSDQPTGGMKALELALVILYVFELSVKLVVHQQYFFCNDDWGWNCFDFFLIVLGVFDIISSYASSDVIANVQFMRLVRLLKLAKILRVFRAIRFFRELRVMANSIAYSLSVMFWAFVLLALILYIGGLFFVQMMAGYLDAEKGITSSTREDVNRTFGSVGHAVLSLYQSASGGVDWKEVYSVVELSGTFGSAGFIFFIWFFNFAVLNILSGIFMEKAMRAAEPDRNQLALDHLRAEESDVFMLTNLLTSMDTDNSGKITLEEFVKDAHEPHVNAYLRALGINIDDASMFFNLVQSMVGSKEVRITEFVDKLIKMKGNATGLDVQSVAYEVCMLQQMLNDAESFKLWHANRDKSLPQIG